METTIFKKMKVEPNYIAHAIHPPSEYPTKRLEFEFKTNEEEFDFVHLFISSLELQRPHNSKDNDNSLNQLWLML